MLVSLLLLHYQIKLYCIVLHCIVLYNFELTGILSVVYFCFIYSLAEQVIIAPCSNQLPQLAERLLGCTSGTFTADNGLVEKWPTS